VIIMTTADRIDPIGYRAWTQPVVVADKEKYVGTHRRPGVRLFSLHALFHIARHARRR
jgi:hypothetical protein